MTADPSAEPVLALDAGQSGSRARLVTGSGVREAAAGGVRLVVDEASAAHSAAVVGELWDELGRPRCAVTVLGTTAFSRCAELNAWLARRVAEVTGTGRVVLAVDSVTSHVGALANAPGVVAAVGTGVTVCMRDGGTWLGWLDGHGTVFGDRGGGYGIGLAGLRFAARCTDLGDDAHPLLLRATGRFGAVREWPFELRGPAATARIASFAVDVLACAAAGDPAAGRIRAVAAADLAETVAAAVRRLGAGGQVKVSWAGSVLSDTALRGEFLRRLAELSPAARPRPPAGSALDGAVHLARDPGLVPAPGFVEVHPGRPRPVPAARGR
ncbi:MAG TPA: BadF/BadG/BcrA/BcrD ATPase family protein [Streptosporangiales bacterium]